MMRSLATSGSQSGSFWNDPKRKVAFWTALLVVVLIVTFSRETWNGREYQRFSFLSGDPAQGARLFSSLGCNACHALYGIGPAIGADLAKTTDARWSPVRTVAEMWSHGPEMWEKMKDAQLGFPRVSEKNMLDLLAYLYLIRYVDQPGDPDNGKNLFSSKHCVDCHAVYGALGGTGPDLSRLDGDTPIVWAQRMWNHGQVMQEFMAQENIAWPIFQDEEMVDLLSYLQQTSTGTRQEADLFPADPTQGERLFRDKGCMGCHATDGMENKAGPDLGSRHKVPPSITQFAGLMWNHSPRMFAQKEAQAAVRPEFAEHEMADLIAYLYVIRYLEPVGRVDLGREVFHEKHCANCHGTDGHGGNGGPNLARRMVYHTPQMAYTVWTHGPQMYSRMREQNIAWPTLDEQELTDLMAFLSSL